MSASYGVSFGDLIDQPNEYCGYKIVTEAGYPAESDSPPDILKPFLDL